MLKCLDSQRIEQNSPVPILATLSEMEQQICGQFGVAQFSSLGNGSFLSFLSSCAQSEGASALLGLVGAQGRGDFISKDTIIEFIHQCAVCPLKRHVCDLIYARFPATMWPEILN